MGRQIIVLHDLASSTQSPLICSIGLIAQSTNLETCSSFWEAWTNTREYVRPINVCFFVESSSLQGTPRIMAASNAAEGCPAYSEVDHGTSQRIVAEEDYQPQDTLYPSSPPGFSSSEEEIPRGRKRRRFSYTMAKRSAGEAHGLRNISFPPSDTRDPSRKRSQSPAKTRNQLELCTPPVIHKSADYQPQHPVTRSRIKKFVQELSDETRIFTAAEKVSTAVSRIVAVSRVLIDVYD